VCDSNVARALLRRGTFLHDRGLFFQDLFLSGLDSGLVSLRQACYRLVSAFSIPVYSPRDKRGRSCSRNPGLRFGIRADNRRFRIQNIGPRRAERGKIDHPGGSLGKRMLGFDREKIGRSSAVLFLVFDPIRETRRSGCSKTRIREVGGFFWAEGLWLFCSTWLFESLSSYNGRYLVL
jgi:hypothetical protein